MTQSVCSGWDMMMIMITTPHYFTIDYRLYLYQYEPLLTDKCFKPDRHSVLCHDNSQLNFIFCLCQYGINELANYTFWHKKSIIFYKDSGVGGCFINRIYNMQSTI